MELREKEHQKKTFKLLFSIALFIGVALPVLLLVALTYPLWGQYVGAYGGQRYPEMCLARAVKGCEWREGVDEPRLVILNDAGRVLHYIGGYEVQEQEVRGVLIRTGDVMEEHMKGWRNER